MARSSVSSGIGYALIVLIGILSFRSFAGFLSPNFDADQAVHVLMSYDLQLPEDWYYWGQNRLGSLLPILSHGLLQVMPLPPIQAVSFVQYAFVIVGFLCYASLLKQLCLKVIFALIWFLPAAPFQKLVEVAHPYAPQFALLGIALVAAHRLATMPETPLLPRMGLNTLIILSFTLSIWVSDLSLLPAGVAAVWASKSILSDQKGWRPLAHLEYLRQRPLCWYNALLLGLAGAFLVYVKSTASQRDENYGVFAINGLESMGQIIGSVLSNIVRTVLFQVNHPILSLYCLASLVTIGSLCFYLRKVYQGTFPFSVQWLSLLLATAISMGISILLSRWTLIQGVPARYFIGIYLCGWLAALLMVDQFAATRQLASGSLHRLTALLCLTALLGSLSLPPYVFTIDKPPSRLAMLQPLAAIGEAGLIGEYWSSYLLCIAAPEQLSCTPHDQDFARCPRCVQQVLQSPVIYLVSKGWLSAFPNELEQFGQRLRQQQPAQPIAGYWMAPYRVVSSASQ